MYCSRCPIMDGRLSDETQTQQNETIVHPRWFCVINFHIKILLSSWKTFWSLPVLLLMFHYYVHFYFTTSKVFVQFFPPHRQFRNSNWFWTSTSSTSSLWAQLNLYSISAQPSNPKIGQQPPTPRHLLQSCFFWFPSTTRLVSPSHRI